MPLDDYTEEIEIARKKRETQKPVSTTTAKIPKGKEKLYKAAQRAGIGSDIADDFYDVMYNVESGASHYDKSGRVKQSPYNPKVGQRAVGFSQILPSTAKQFNLDPYDEDQNIEAGLRYFASFGKDPKGRRIGYFGGPGAFNKYRRTGQIPKGGDVTGTTFDEYVNKSMKGKKSQPMPQEIDADVESTPTPAYDDTDYSAEIAEAKKKYEQRLSSIQKGENQQTPEEYRAYLQSKVNERLQPTTPTQDIQAETTPPIEQPTTASPQGRTVIRKLAPKEPLQEIASRDIQWHLGLDETQFGQLSKAEQQRAINLTRWAVRNDEEKKAQGQEIGQPTGGYQREMRRQANIKTKPTRVEDSNAYRQALQQGYSPQDALALARGTQPTVSDALKPSNLGTTGVVRRGGEALKKVQTEFEPPPSEARQKFLADQETAAKEQIRQQLRQEKYAELQEQERQNEQTGFKYSVPQSNDALLAQANQYANTETDRMTMNRSALDVLASRQQSAQKEVERQARVSQMSTPRYLWEQTKSAPANVIKGALQIAPQLAEAGGVVSYGIERGGAEVMALLTGDKKWKGKRLPIGNMITGGTGSPTLPEAEAYMAGGEKMREWIDRYSWANPDLDPSVVQQVSKGIGQILPMVAGGWIAKSATVLPAAFGITAGMSEGWRDAKQSGATDDQAFVSALLNGGVGVTEIVPVGGWIDRLNKASGGRFKSSLFQFLKHSAVEGFEEGLQEYFQTKAGNEIGRYIYGKDPKAFDSPEFAGLVAFLTGGLAGGGTQAVSSGISRSAERTQAKERAAQIVDATNQIDAMNLFNPANAQVQVAPQDVAASEQAINNIAENLPIATPQKPRVIKQNAPIQNAQTAASSQSQVQAEQAEGLSDDEILNLTPREFRAWRQSKQDEIAQFPERKDAIESQVRDMVARKVEKDKVDVLAADIGKIYDKGDKLYIQGDTAGVITPEQRRRAMLAAKQAGYELTNETPNPKATNTSFDITPLTEQPEVEIAKAKREPIQEAAAPVAQERVFDKQIEAGRRKKSIRVELERRLSDERTRRNEAERAANTDPLTGLGNRVALDKALPSAESDPNTSVIAFDANNFGKVNKAVSQEAGDALIKELGAAVRQAAKEGGVEARAFRRGGDELVILAPKEKAEQIRKRAEVIFGDKSFEGNKEIAPFTVSLSGTVGDTFNEADATLQSEKKVRKESQVINQTETPKRQTTQQPTVDYNQVLKIQSEIRAGENVSFKPLDNLPLEGRQQVAKDILERSKDNKRISTAAIEWAKQQTEQPKVETPEITKEESTIEALPISERITKEDLADTGSFTKKKAAASVKKERVNEKTGFTQTQTEWFVAELHKAYDKFESDKPVYSGEKLSKDRHHLAELQTDILQLQRDISEMQKALKSRKLSDESRSSIQEKIKAKRDTLANRRKSVENYTDVIKAEEGIRDTKVTIIEVPNDGTFRFYSREGINRAHKKLTGKTVEDFRKAKARGKAQKYVIAQGEDWAVVQATPVNTATWKGFEDVSLFLHEQKSEYVIREASTGQIVESLNKKIRSEDDFIKEVKDNLVTKVGRAKFDEAVAKHKKVPDIQTARASQAIAKIKKEGDVEIVLENELSTQETRQKPSELSKEELKAKTKEAFKKKRGTTLGTGFGALQNFYEALEDAAPFVMELAKREIKEGVSNLKDFTARMKANVGEFWDEVEPHIENLYNFVSGKDEKALEKPLQQKTKDVTTQEGNLKERGLVETAREAGLGEVSEEARFYEERAQERTRQEALDFIKRQGVSASVQYVKEAQEFNAAVSGVGVELLKGLAKESVEGKTDAARNAASAYTQDVLDALAKKGTEAGQFINYFNTMAKESPEGALIYIQRKASEQGKTLTQAEKKEVYSSAVSLKEHQEALDKIQALEKQIQQSKVQSPKPKPSEKVKTPTQQLREWANKAEAEAKATLRSVKFYSGLILPPEAIAALAKLGAAKLAKGIVKIADWRTAMSADINAVSPNVTNKFDDEDWANLRRQSVKEYANERAKTRRDEDIKRLIGDDLDNYSPTEVEEILAEDRAEKRAKASEKARFEAEVRRSAEGVSKPTLKRGKAGIPKPPKETFKNEIDNALDNAKAQQKVIDAAKLFNAPNYNRNDALRQMKAANKDMSVKDVHKLEVEAYKLYKDTKAEVTMIRLEKRLADGKTVSPEDMETLKQARIDAQRAKSQARLELNKLLKMYEQPARPLLVRANNLTRRAMLSSFQTVFTNVWGQVVTTPMTSFDSAFELLISKALRKVEKDDSKLGKITKTLIPNREDVLDADISPIDALLPIFYMVKFNRDVINGEKWGKHKIAESVFSEHPDIYHEYYGTLAGDIEREQSKRVEGKTRLLHRGIDGANKVFDVIQTPLKIQEINFRDAVAVGLLSAHLKAKGKTLEGVIANNEFDQIPPEILEKIAHLALEATGVNQSKSLFSRVVKSTAEWTPAVMHPATFAGFMMWATRFTFEHSPAVLLKTLKPALGKVVGKDWQGLSARDVGKAITGAIVWSFVLGMYAVTHDDDDEWYMATIPFTETKLNIRSMFPFNFYYFTIYSLDQARKGKPLPPISELAAAMTGYDARYADDNLAWRALKGGLGWYDAWRKGDDTAAAKSYLGKTGLMAVGNTLGAFVTPFKTVKDIYSIFDENEAVKRNLREAPFTGAILSKIPYASQSLPAVTKDGEPVKETMPALKQVGLKLSKKGETDTPAERMIKEFATENSNESLLDIPDEEKISTVYKLKQRAKAGEDVTAELERLVKEDKISEKSAENILKGRDESRLETLVREGRLTLEQMKAVMQFANGEEKRKLAPILRYKEATDKAKDRERGDVDYKKALKEKEKSEREFAQNLPPSYKELPESEKEIIRKVHGGTIYEGVEMLKLAENEKTKKIIRVILNEKAARKRAKSEMSRGETEAMREIK